MYARRVKRKCGVRGCRNTESYAISRTREAGYSVIICKSCLKEALDELHKTIPAETAAENKQTNTGAQQPDTKAELKASDEVDKKAVKKKASTTASVKKN